MKELKLKQLEDKDLPLIEKWLNQEYIRKWYNDPEEWLHEMRERNGDFSFLHHFLVYDDTNLIGFCQYYDCYDAQEEWYGVSIPNQKYSVDYLIGEEAYLGKGYGKAIVKTLLDRIKQIDGAKQIVVQPDEDNFPSTKSLLANGFRFDNNLGYYLIDLD